MSNLNLKKNSVLGANTLSFIASMVSKSLNPAPSLTTSLVNEQSNDVKETTENLVETSINEFISLEIKTDTESDFSLKNKNIKTGEKSDLPISFKLLSISATDEYKTKENYLKGCRWSPDGTCIITNSDDSILRIFDTTTDMLNVNSQENPIQIKSSLKLAEPALIYDYAWFPFMSSSDPATACVFSTCKENPIHLFDAYTGSIRCSYKGYNHLDELDTAYCIAFNSDCSKIYCGYNKCIKVFDISRPGKNYHDIEIKKGQYKLPGIVSCISFSPDKNSSVYAVGTYSKYIGIYVTETDEPVCLIEGHSGGLTHLMFSKDGNKLFSGARKDSDIYCWDVRNPGKVLQVFKRDVQTNQRIYFDLDSDKYLFSGNNNGTVSVWKADEFDLSAESEPEIYSFKAHDDCVNGTSYNPQYSLFATSSGQRKFFFNNYSNKNESCSSSESDDDLTNQTYENSLKIWKYC